MKIKFNENKDRYFKYIVIAYMVLYFIIGVSTIKDYGISTDEQAQRNHSLVSYKYICEEILGRDMSGYEVFSNLPDLENYRGARYYGVLLQLPFVVIEDIYDFSLQTRTIYLIRHLGTFCYCCLGFIFFYLFLKKVFKNRGYAFFGLLLISLYPRFFGEKFYNIKDLVFVATCCLSYYGIALYLENGRKIRYGIIAGLFFAICTSSRMMGAMFPAILVGYLLLQDILNKAFSKEKVQLGKNSVPSWLKCIIDYCSIIVSYFAFWYLVTPAAWGKNVFTTFIQAFTYFGYYGSNQSALFAGQSLHAKEMPWHYLYTWIGITVPVYYIVLFFIGHAYWFKGTAGIKDWFEKALAENKYISLSVAMFWGPSVLVALHMINIYNAWRHMYFIMCPFVVLAVYGLKFILEFGTGKIGAVIRKAAVCLIVICMAVQVRWLYVNHPYQQLYFNEIGKPIAWQFQRDYWKTSVCDLLEYILANDDRERITVYPSPVYEISLLLLPDYDKNRIAMDKAAPDYYVTVYEYMADYDYCPEGYYEYYSIVVDGIKMATVFKR